MTEGRNGRGWRAVTAALAAALVMMVAAVGVTTVRGGASDLRPDIPVGLHRSSVDFYVNNTGSVPTGNFNEQLNLDFCALEGMASNLSDLMVEYSNGTSVPTWVQSGCSNDAVAAETSPEVWVYLYSIGAHSSDKLTASVDPLGFMLSSAGPTGAAPAFGVADVKAPFYGAWDDGGSVFPFYDDFAGTSLNARWGYTTGFTIAVDDGLSLTSSAAGSEIVAAQLGSNISSPPNGRNVVVEADEQFICGSACSVTYRNTLQVGVSTYNANSNQYAAGESVSLATVSSGGSAVAGEFNGTDAGGNFIPNPSATPPWETTSGYTLASVSVVNASAGGGLPSAGSPFIYVNASESSDGFPQSVDSASSYHSTVAANFAPYQTVVLRGYQGGAQTQVAVQWVFVGLLPATLANVTVGVTALGADQPLPCSSAPAADAGWSAYCSTIDYQNITLKDYGGMNYSVGGQTMRDGPVITNNDPTHSLVAYYINASNDLVEENLTDQVVTLLHSWVPNIASHDAYQELNAFTLPRGEVVGLYETGVTTSSHQFAQLYNLLNGSYVERDFGSSWASPTGAEQGYGLYSLDGWTYWQDGAVSVQEFLNIYSGASVSVASSTNTNSEWNSPVFIPGPNQVIEDVSGGTGYAEVVATNLSFPGGVPYTATTAFTSGVSPFYTAAQSNNMPYYYTILPNGTTLLWGIETNDGGGTTYHNLAVYLPSTATSSDAVAWVNDTDAVGTIGAYDANMPVYDPNGMSINGMDSYQSTPALGIQYQAPLLNPNNFSATWSFNPWLNEFIHTQFFTGMAGSGVDSGLWEEWEYSPNSTAIQGAVVHDTNSSLNPPGDNITVLLFWDPGQICLFQNCSTTVVVFPPPAGGCGIPCLILLFLVGAPTVGVGLFYLVRADPFGRHRWSGSRSGSRRNRKWG